jgi:hypothetical protein
MSDQATNEFVNDLTRDWPDDPENPKLVTLSQTLRQSSPALPAESLERIRADLRRGLVRRQREIIIWRWAPLAAAASLLVCVGGAYLFRHATPGAGTTGQGPVRDTYQVVFTVPPTPAPDQPLVALERYASLY